MKKIFTIVICAVALMFISKDSNAQFRIGVGGSMTFNPTYIGPQLRVAFDLNDKVRLAGAGTYYLGSSSFLAFDVDIRYKLAMLGNVAVEPLAGLYINDGGVALNLGVHFRIEKEGSDIYIEPKFIVDKTSIFALGAGFFF